MVSCTVKVWDGLPVVSAAVMTRVWVPFGVPEVGGGVVVWVDDGDEELQAESWRRLKASNRARSEFWAKYLCPRWMRLRKRARPKRVAQVIPCRGSKGLLRRASSGAVVEMTKTEVTCENPLRDLTVGGVKVQASPLSSWPHENLTVPL